MSAAREAALRREPATSPATRPRVLLVSNRAEVVGGGEISLLLLAGGLRELALHDVVVAVPAEGEVAARARAAGIPVAHVALPGIRRRPWSLRRSTRSTAETLAGIGADLVHANGTRAMLLAGRAARSLDLPVVWHVRVEPRDRLDGWLARRASAIVVPSRAVGARFAGREVDVIPNPVAPGRTPAASPAGAAGRPLAAVPRPDDTGRSWRSEGPRAGASGPRPVPNPERTGHGGPADVLTLLVAARLSPDRGHDRILEALAAFQRPWRLLVAGGPDPDDPDHAARLQRRVEAAGWADRVEMLGFRDDLDRVMARCDLLVHAPATEGFGRLYVEAMAAGLPAVVTPAGGLREIHEETGYGWMADDLEPASLTRALEEAAADEVGRRACRRRGPVIVAARYSVEAHARSVAAVYERLLSS